MAGLVGMATEHVLKVVYSVCMCVRINSSLTTEASERLGFWLCHFLPELYKTGKDLCEDPVKM